VISPGRSLRTGRRTPRGLVAAAAAALAVGAVSGCGSDPQAVNDADATFAAHQVTHHAQTVHLLNLSLGRKAVRSEAALLADETRADHLNEIGTLSRWLRRHDLPVPDTGLTHAEEGRHVEFDTSVPGVLGPQDVAALEGSSNKTFERVWLAALIVHEQGAVRVAENEIQNGQNATTVAFAKRDKAAHAQRLARLRRLTTP
jgi:uncharacterized protein (DUF305 family)